MLSTMKAFKTRLTAREVDYAGTGKVVVALYPEPALPVPGPVRDELGGQFLSQIYLGICC